MPSRIFSTRDGVPAARVSLLLVGLVLVIVAGLTPRTQYGRAEERASQQSPPAQTQPSAPAGVSSLQSSDMIGLVEQVDQNEARVNESDDPLNQQPEFSEFTVRFPQESTPLGLEVEGNRQHVDPAVREYNIRVQSTARMVRLVAEWKDAENGPYRVCFWAGVPLLPADRVVEIWTAHDDSRRPASGAYQVASYLAALHELYAPGEPPDILKTDINTLGLLVRRLHSLDSHIRKIGPGLEAEYLLDRAEKHRATAWLHAWALFGRLAIDISRDNPELRAPLLGLAAQNDGPKPVLALLLETYRQICDANARVRASLAKEPPQGQQAVPQEAAGGVEQPGQPSGEVADPFRLRLPDAGTAWASLHFSRTWPQRKGGVPRIPSPAELVGKATDEPRWDDKTGILSLWQLVNLQLDTWHNWFFTEGETLPDSPGLESMGDWATALGATQALHAFDGGPAFAERVAKIGRFLTCRDKLSNRELLQKVLAVVADRRVRLRENLQGLLSAQPPEEESEVIRIMQDLCSAASPTEDKEYLPDAAIWLRYIVLLSYQGDGGVTAVHAGEQTIEKYWNQIDGKQFVLTPSNERRTCAALRWNMWPPKDHATDLLDELTLTTYKLLEFQASLLALERHRYGDNEASPASLDEVVGQFTKAIYGRLTDQEDEPALMRLQWATQLEKGRLNEDLKELWQRVKTLKVTHKLLTSFDANDPSRPSVLAYLACTPELADFDLTESPARTLEQHVAEIRSLAEAIKAKLEEEEAREAVYRNYVDSYDYVQECELERQAKQFARDAAKYSLEAARIYENIAELEKQMAELLKLASEQNLQGYGLAHRSAGIRLTIATRVRDLAAAELVALEEALEHARTVIIPRARAELQQLQKDILAAADRVESAAKRVRVFGWVNLEPIPK